MTCPIPVVRRDDVGASHDSAEHFAESFAALSRVVVAAYAKLPPIAQREIRCRCYGVVTACMPVNVVGRLSHPPHPPPRIDDSSAGPGGTRGRTRTMTSTASPPVVPACFRPLCCRSGHILCSVLPHIVLCIAAYCAACCRILCSVLPHIVQRCCRHRVIRGALLNSNSNSNWRACDR